MAKRIECINLYEASTWSKTHSAHHKAHGNSTIYDNTRTVLTLSEFNKLSYYKQIGYHILRNPIIFFLVGPLYLFWICKISNGEWIMLIKYVIFLALLYRIGSFKLLISFMIAQYIAGMIGLILFHLQHQVNVGFWKEFSEKDQLMKDNAELLGASVLKVPWGLDFFTNGIEYHNIHHLDPGVPSYLTASCYHELVSRGMIPDSKIGYWQAFKSLFHVIYNEESERYESSPFFQSIGLQA